MSRTSPLLSPLESMQISWGLKLRDFKQWCQPTTQAVYNWKQRRLETAITVAKTTMADDVEKMLRALVENDNVTVIGAKNEKGTSAYLPVLITAISPIEMPPDYDEVRGMSAWHDVVIPSDPQQRLVQMRTMAVAYRCQIAFFAPDPHSCSSVVNQFISYWKHEGKRTFPVQYQVGYTGDDPIKMNWNFRVLDNSLSADSADVGLDHTYVATVDCTIVGAEPTVIGLGGQWDSSTDAGEPINTLPTAKGKGKGNVYTGYPPDPNKSNDPNDPNNPNNSHTSGKPLIDPVRGFQSPFAYDENGKRIDGVGNYGKVVIEADVYVAGKPNKTRVKIDKETKIVTQTELDLDKP